MLRPTEAVIGTEVTWLVESDLPPTITCPNHHIDVKEVKPFVYIACFTPQTNGTLIINEGLFSWELKVKEHQIDERIQAVETQEIKIRTHDPLTVQRAKNLQSARTPSFCDSNACVVKSAFK